MEGLRDIWQNLADDLNSGKIKMAHYRECPSCLNTGWKSIKQSDEMSRIHEGVIKCQDCAFWFKRYSAAA